MISDREDKVTDEQFYALLEPVEKMFGRGSALVDKLFAKLGSNHSGRKRQIDACYRDIAMLLQQVRDERERPF